MDAARRQSIVNRAELVFAFWACLFFWALFMCILAHDPDAALTAGPAGPVPYRLICGGAAGLGGAAALFALLYGGWRPLLVDLLVFAALGLNAVALAVCFRTWEALGMAVPVAWSVTAALTGILLVLVDFAVWLIVRKLSSPRSF